jgi:hypothetical protein
MTILVRLANGYYNLDVDCIWNLFLSETVLKNTELMQGIGLRNKMLWRLRET